MIAIICYLLLSSVIIFCRTLRKWWRNRPNWYCRYRYCDCCQCCQNKVTDEEALADEDKKMTFDYVENERLKPVLDDFTLSEYTEKILQYGFLMVSLS